jgi:hypothetical protein
MQRIVKNERRNMSERDGRGKREKKRERIARDAQESQP